MARRASPTGLTPSRKKWWAACIIIEADSHDEALRIASMHPAATLGEDGGWAVELIPHRFLPGPMRGWGAWLKNALALFSPQSPSRLRGHCGDVRIYLDFIQTIINYRNRDNVNCADTVCTNSASGYASAKLLMLRLRPAASGQADRFRINAGNAGLLRSHLDRTTGPCGASSTGLTSRAKNVGYRYDRLYQISSLLPAAKVGIEGYRIWQFTLTKLKDEQISMPPAVAPQIAVHRRVANPAHRHHDHSAAPGS